jgi:hypothetical protein
VIRRARVRCEGGMRDARRAACVGSGAARAAATALERSTGQLATGARWGFTPKQAAAA